jgi:hypothetical protein
MMRALLFVATAVTVCISLICVGEAFHYLDIVPRVHLAGLAVALAGTISFGAIAFVILRKAPFSFGYAVSFSFFCVILGYLWISPFSRLQYDHASAIASAFVSGLFFIFAANARAVQLPRIVLPLKVASWLPIVFLGVAALTIAAGARYNFRPVWISDIYRFRDELDFPAPVRYANGIVLTALLPFSFAWFVERRRYVLAGLSLLLMAAFYPVTLTKFSIFAPLWLCFLFALSRFVEARIAVILSILLPMSAGLVFLAIDAYRVVPVYHVFGLVNFRMIAIPSISLDIYNAFFADHPHTYFCQINIIRAFYGCHYGPQLGVEIANAYHLGNFNASLFSIEGIASVGLAWAPIVALVCGIIIAVGTSSGSHLPDRFILLSSCIVVQALINVPLATVLLSHGLGLLFVLWYLTPAAGLATADSPTVLKTPSP